jgi:DNA-directed RNA polymerase specialized sigma subunit
LTQLSEAKAILRNYHALTERQYKGDTDAICTLVDLGNAVRLAKLTDRQTEALTLVYVEDMTQKSAGERMGITREVVKEHADIAVQAIEDVYEMWAWLDGTLTPEDFTENETEAVA